MKKVLPLTLTFFPLEVQNLKLKNAQFLMNVTPLKCFVQVTYIVILYQSVGG